jgi:hypothetical protein
MAEAKAAPARRRRASSKLLAQSFDNDFSRLAPEHPTSAAPTAPIQTATMNEAFALLTAELQQVEESVPQEESAPENEAETERKSSNPYPGNGLYKGKIGRFEVWQGRKGYAVWTVEPDPYYGLCHAVDIPTLKQALESARHLDAIEQADNTAYLAKLRLPR